MYILCQAIKPEISSSQGQPVLSAAVECPVLTDPLNGSVFFTTTTFNSVATYECDDGFILSGSEQRTCLETGQWSGEDPTCVRK